MISSVKKQPDPEAGKRIAEVRYLEKLKAFLVRMENGNAYVLSVADLPEADASGIAKWSLARDHTHFRVTQESGNCLEIPWDDVLYHCEPEYEYYKGKYIANEGSQTIGERVRRLRKTRGYSIEELAGRAGMKRPNLSRLEHGKHTPSLETLEKIAAALAVPVVDIVAGITATSP
ncbi:MAG: helix-turn-helix transcriptional regulator [Chloroflexi bacterium]|nr:helix-turn-helix transcriptional regulator [Chloroflexota bacterium]